ncbi:hypothetical protein MO867_20430 [Microbulbifer sp. OS29]|uniref:Phage protein n=1 Tax=Microbulbifer okhotskensis TaxID=2926617 RepID=A0A9X2EQS8_9GAMM|nr:hypothetical protein [Microbulbifer okhotskensis]MCO1336697.1 hypothetical protein [Microbulbifer okhotskensis]
MNFLIQIAVMIVAAYVSAALNKPPKPKPAALTDWDFPTPDEGTRRAIIFGDCWMSSWMVLGVGNYRTRQLKLDSGGKK